MRVNSWDFKHKWQLKKKHIKTVPTFAIIKNGKDSKEFIDEYGAYHGFKDGEVVTFVDKSSDDFWLWKNDEYHQLISKEDFILC